MNETKILQLLLFGRFGLSFFGLDAMDDLVLINLVGLLRMQQFHRLRFVRSPTTLGFQFWMFCTTRWPVGSDRIYSQFLQAAKCRPPKQHPQWLNYRLQHISYLLLSNTFRMHSMQAPPFSFPIRFARMDNRRRLEPSAKTNKQKSQSKTH